MFQENKKQKVPTLSVSIPQSRALESVSNAASTLRAAIRRQASYTVVLSGIVRALDNRNRLTVRSLVSTLLHEMEKKIYLLIIKK